MARKVAAPLAPIQKLTIFLLKDGVDTSELALKAPSQLDRRSVTAGGAAIGELFFKKNKQSRAKWLDLFSDAEGLTLPALFNLSTAAVFLVQRKTRLFALTFGFGRHLLKPGAWEEQFGLRVTLNTVNPLELRSLDHKKFEAIASHSRTQTSQAAGVAAFGLNVEQDLLCAATGDPIDPSLGKRMSGMDALAVSVRLRLKGLAALVDRYLLQFNDTAYKRSFPWIDHIGEVRDPTLRDDLDKELVEVLRTENIADLRAWLLVPRLIDWAQVGGFHYGDASGELATDLHLKDFFEILRDRSALSLNALKMRHAYAVGVEGDQVIDRWTIYECLYCELARSDTTYLLTGGKWYRVERNFVRSVNRAVKKLVRARKLPLPDYADTDEGAYNTRAAKTSKGKLALLDRKLIMIGGSPVEACDLFGKTREMIHVKRYGGSSVLSHLFAQGGVAARSFFQDPAFRTAFNKLLPRSHRLTDPVARPDPSKFEIVYAIVSRSAKPIDEGLPFFSRLNLRTAAAQLEGFGFRVSLVKIPTT